MKKVNKEEFDAFIKNYPRELKGDIAGMREPPMLSYNDFTIAEKWPESIVAKAFLNEDYPIRPEPNEYFIKEP